MPDSTILDTTVLLASSLIEATGKLGFTIKHDFYECSQELIQHLKENRVGIVTNFIEVGAYSVLSKVVEEELVRARSRGAEIELEASSALLNICSDNLDDLLRALVREPINEKAVSRIYHEVDVFFEDLVEMAHEKREELIKKGYFRIKSLPLRRPFKKLAQEIYKRQEDWENAQLLNLLFRKVGTRHKRILSETIYLNNVFNLIYGEMTTYLASTDHRFSPIIKGGRKSSIVTDEIFKKFGIACNWPNEIYELIKK